LAYKLAFHTEESIGSSIKADFDRVVSESDMGMVVINQLTIIASESNSIKECGQGVSDKVVQTKL
jgi:hypothetical protein